MGLGGRAGGAAAGGALRASQRLGGGGGGGGGGGEVAEKGAGGGGSGSALAGRPRERGPAAAPPAGAAAAPSVAEQRAERILRASEDEGSSSSGDESEGSAGGSASSVPPPGAGGGPAETGAGGAGEGSDGGGGSDSDSDGDGSDSPGGGHWPLRKSGRPRVEPRPGSLPDPAEESESDEGGGWGSAGGGETLASPFVYQRRLAQGREALPPATPRRAPGGTTLLGSSDDDSSSDGDDDRYSNWPSAFRTPKDPPARPRGSSPPAGRDLEGELMSPAASEMSRGVMSALESMEKPRASRSGRGRGPDGVARAVLSGEAAVSPGVFQALKDEYESVREASPPLRGRTPPPSNPPGAHLNPELLFGGGGPQQPAPAGSAAATPPAGLGPPPNSASRGRAMSTPSSQEAVDRLEEQEAHLANVQADLGQLLHTTSKLREALHQSPPGGEGASFADSAGEAASPQIDGGAARPASWASAGERGLGGDARLALASLDALEEKVALLLRERALTAGLARRLEALATEVRNLQSEVGLPGKGGGPAAALRDQVAALSGGLSSLGRDLEAFKEDQASHEADVQAGHAELDLRLAATAGRTEELEERVLGAGREVESLSSLAAALSETVDRVGGRVEEVEAEARALRGARPPSPGTPPSGSPRGGRGAGQEAGAAGETAEDAAAGVAEALQSFQSLWQKMELQRQEIEAGRSEGAPPSAEELRAQVDAAVGAALAGVVRELQERYEILALSVAELRSASAAPAALGEDALGEDALGEDAGTGAGELVVGRLTEIQAKMAIMEAEAAGVADELERRLAASDAGHRAAAAALSREVEALKLLAPAGAPGPTGREQELLEGAGWSSSGAAGGDVGGMLEKLCELEKCVGDIDQEVKSLSWIAESEGPAPRAPAVGPPASPSVEKMEELLPGILRRELGSFAETLVHMEGAVARLDLELKEATRSAESRADALDGKLRGLEAAVAGAAAEAAAAPASSPAADGPAAADALVSKVRSDFESEVARLEAELRGGRQAAEARGEALEEKLRDLAAATSGPPSAPRPPASPPASPAPPQAGAGADAGSLEETVAGLVQRPLGGLLRKSRELEARLAEIVAENRALGEKAARAEEAVRGLERRMAEGGGTSPPQEGVYDKGALAPAPAGGRPPPPPAPTSGSPQPLQQGLGVATVALVFAVLNCSLLWLSALFSLDGLGGALDLAREARLPLAT